MVLPTELQRVIERALDSPGITALAMVLLLVVPVMASSGASRIEPRATSPAGADAQRAADTRYEMRCWQQGRLVFEQNLAELPTIDASHYALKVSGTDRDGRPVYVAETSNATCLVRKAADSGARDH
jgi:hypothetical protein